MCTSFIGAYLIIIISYIEREENEEVYRVKIQTGQTSRTLGKILL